jgi:hypothetical protein
LKFFFTESRRQNPARAVTKMAKRKLKPKARKKIMAKRPKGRKPSKKGKMSKVRKLIRLAKKRR